MNILAAAAVLLHAVATPPAQPPERYRAIADKPPLNSPALEKFPYSRYLTTDKLGRRITFYLSKDPDATNDPPAKPLVVCVQGSGSQSVFIEVSTPDGKRIGSGGPEAAVLKLARDTARILVVEKPGVEFLVQPSRPGSAEEATEEFRREHTLDRWTEAINAAVTAAGTLPGVDTSRILALGHSEGGQVVCRLAAANPRITHIATLAGGGPTQLFDLIELARSGVLSPPGVSGEAAARQIIDGWRTVQQSPEAHDRFWLGHPHRRWSSFLATSPLEGLLASNARIFIGQGTSDTATSPAAADVLYAELLARGRDVTYRRVEGGDHGFAQPGDAQRQGWLDMHRAALEWFLGEALPPTPATNAKP